MQHEAPTKHETLKLAQRKQIRSEKIHRRERNEELDSECRRKEFEERRLSETQNRKQLLLPKGQRNRNGPDKMIKSSTFCCVTPALSKNKNKKKL